MTRRQQLAAEAQRNVGPPAAGRRSLWRARVYLMLGGSALATGSALMVDGGWAAA